MLLGFVYEINFVKYLVHQIQQFPHITANTSSTKMGKHSDKFPRLQARLIAINSLSKSTSQRRFDMEIHEQNKALKPIKPS